MTDGVLLVDKPQGPTSFDVIARLRRLYGTRQIGHTGTLDPMATGLLVVLIGSAAKAAEYLSAERKEYLAGMRLGMTTDTEDVTGKFLTQTDAVPPRDKVIAAAKSFLGESMQIPPMVSALKVGGQKLVDLARQGIVVERQPRPITVYALDIDGDGAEYQMRADVSKGTYIRTLCADIGAKLGCGAALSSLRRTKAGDFSLADAHTLDEIEALDEKGRAALLIPTESLFSALPLVTLPDFFAGLCRNGCEIYQRKIGTSFAVGTRVRLADKTSFFALGEVRDYPDGTAVKAIKRF